VPAEAWALFSTFCFAGAHVASKRGLDDTSVIAGSLVLLAASFGVIAVAFVLDPPARVTSEALLVYGGLGLIVPAISRGAALKAVDSFGPSIAVPIQHGLRPILAVGFGAGRVADRRGGRAGPASSTPVRPRGLGDSRWAAA
jgi:drug/metabolite transporter (DMT)-like permease